GHISDGLRSVVRMRIGEILLERGLLDWDALATALTDQRPNRMRLCSLLVVRRLLDFDQASQALGEQWHAPAALRRHLVHRDRSVAALLPSAIGKRAVAIPIGRMGDGTLLVCARDPSSQLHDDLARVIGQPIMLAVAPALYLERLVDHVYTEVDVPIDVDEPPPVDFEIEVEEPELDIPVEIEAPEAPKPKNRALPVRIKRLTTETARDSLDETIASFPDIDDLEWLLDVVMGYVAKRWSAALIVAIEDKRAIGLRGHGQRLKPSATRSFILPLSEPSVVQLARDERRIADETPTDAAKRLAVTLDNAAQPTAAPFMTRDTVSHVLVVGDPLAADHDATIRDLEVLIEAMNEALARIG
ncbi:MAG TPA: hypothetical protein VFV99_00830, partial [Kofleriaceae bacterium]|nr:hypothetical protein [Kofleriaceae bacterium]